MLAASTGRASKYCFAAVPACAARRITQKMTTRNFYSALVGLSLDDSPAGSPTAEAAGIKARANGKSYALAAGSEAADSSKTAASETSSSTVSADELKAKPKRPKLSEPLVWIDLEMTGLDIDKDTIIEIACLVTDGDLQTVIEGPDIAIHHSESVLANMNAWCQEHHTKSGLVQRVRESSVSLKEAEQQVLAFIQQHTEYQTAQLAGNSVHVDRLFLQRHMPLLVEHLHYRIVDVSTFKECCRRWKPKIARQAPRKVAAHTAMSDIKESLKELQYYKSVLFKGAK